MKRYAEKILRLTTREIDLLISNCQFVLILGGLKFCDGLCLDKYVEKTGLSKEQLVKWYKKYDKTFLRKLKNKA